MQNERQKDEAAIDQGLTHDDRLVLIYAREQRLLSAPTAKTKKERALIAAHIERLSIIYKPFPVCIKRQSAQIWAGVLIGDRVTGDGAGGRKRRGASNADGDGFYEQRGADVTDAELTALA